MTDDWPTDVQTAILWHHEAEVAAVRAKRALELATEEALDRRKFPIPAGSATTVARETAVERAALDAAELEEAKRHRWLCYVMGREGRTG